MKIDQNFKSDDGLTKMKEINKYRAYLLLQPEPVRIGASHNGEHWSQVIEVPGHWTSGQHLQLVAVGCWNHAIGGENT